MICNKCHVQVEDGVAVCPVCGAAIEPEEMKEQEAITQEPVLFEVEETIDTDAENLQTVEGECDSQVESPTEMESAPVKKKLWIKVTAVVACLALVLGLAAMVWYGVNGSLTPKSNDINYKKQYNVSNNKAKSSADTVIATIGDKKLTNEQFQVLYWMGVYTFLQDYGSYFSLDLDQPLSEQYVKEGGATWEQFFIQSALENWHNYQSLLLYAEKEGYTVSDTLGQQIDAIISDMDEVALTYGLADAEAVVQADMGPAATVAAYRHYLELYYGGMEYFENMYNQVKPSDDEIVAYYEENADALKSNYGVDKESGKLIDVRHILVCPKGGTKDEYGQTTYSQKEWDDCLTEAEALLKKWRDGEATEASFAALASEFTEDPGSQSSGGLYTYVYEGQMVPAFNDWCFDESRQYGDTGIVKTNYGYHIMYFVYGDDGWFRRAKDAFATEVCTDVMEQAMAEFPVEVNFKKITLGRLSTEE